VILIALPVATLILCFALRAPWKMIAMLFLFVPLIASIAVLTYPTDRGFALLSTDFLKAVIGTYFFAVVSFGYCPAALGSIAYRLIRASSAPTRFRRQTLFEAGAVIGALIGISIMIIMILVEAKVRSAPNQALSRDLKGWVVTGLAAGAVSGLLVAAYTTPRSPESPHDQKSVA
jgi:lysylphosphatidylglycerol synthetase-like protein (DUF2156 family)